VSGRAAGGAGRALAYNPGVPETSPAVRRSGDDRCPGVLRLIEAADGFLARVRLPGGLVDAAQLRVLARLADELGDGRLELTSRGNVQLRALAADAATGLTSELSRAGLLPSLSHDRVRNVLASPLAGLDRGPDLTGTVRALDAALCARPRLAQLPGRFLFAVDDGRGDVAGLGADVVATVRPDGAVVNGLAVRRPDVPGNDRPAGRALGTESPDKGARDAAATRADPAGAGGGPDGLRDATVGVMLAFAEAFLDERAALGGSAWRIADLPGGADRIKTTVAARLGLTDARPHGQSHWQSDGQPDGQSGIAATGPSGPAGPADPTGSADRGQAVPSRRRPAAAERDPGAAAVTRPVGLVARAELAGAMESAATVRDDHGFSVVLLAPLGRLTAAQLTWVADRAAGRAARVTPWRSVVLPDAGDAPGVLREAAALGFGTDAGSPWLRVSACAGRPGCASALADVQADAAGFAARWPGRVVHVSGCGRHCGRPAATEIDVTATSEGYEVAGI
jgi:precorrin-3B synthase